MFDTIKCSDTYSCLMIALYTKHYVKHYDTCLQLVNDSITKSVCAYAMFDTVKHSDTYSRSRQHYTKSMCHCVCVCVCVCVCACMPVCILACIEIGKRLGA